MKDIEKFQEQLELATDLINKFTPFFKSFEKLAKQMGYVSKRTIRKRQRRRKRELMKLAEDILSR